MKNPKDFESLLSLAGKYISKSDYRHAMLILDKAIENNSSEDPRKKAKLYNALGVSCLYTGDDRQAKDAFKHAVEADAKNLGARMNLAGLMQYYGHNEKARAIYETILDNELSGHEAYLVHPRARELYYAYNNHKK
jgi:Flp pilus assembly protein TadD